MDVFEAVTNYALGLGKFWLGFNSLEMMLRTYLARRSGMGTGVLMQNLHAGAGVMLTENPITDYKTFKMLCDEFNASVGPREQIDFSRVVLLRDAMAHGRILGDDQGQMYVVKYSRPKSGQVTVELKQSLTNRFVESMIDYLNWATHEVSKHIAVHMRE